MSLDKIKPFNDPRVQLRAANLNGVTYGYLYSEPPLHVARRGTVILVHGFPDISFGWRYQIPFLTSLGLVVIAPDCIGYGRTDAPSFRLSDYGYKRAADDLAALCGQLGLKKILLGGHDWGSIVAWRTTQYYPDLVAALFTFSSPYYPPSLRYQPMPIIRRFLPVLGYQMQMASGTVEPRVKSRREIRLFLNAVFSSLNSTRSDRRIFNVREGLDLDLILSGSLPPTNLLTSEELDYYVTEYFRHGLNGPSNWYRTREVNWLDEYTFFFGNGKTTKPNLNFEGKHEILFVRSLHDPAISEDMVAHMLPFVDKLTYHELETGHWILWEEPEKVNKILGQWLEEKVFSKGSVLSKL